MPVPRTMLVVAAATLVLPLAGQAGSSAASSAAEPAGAAATRGSAAPAFLELGPPTSARRAASGAARSVREVDLDTSLLPDQATGQAIGFDVGRSRALEGRIERVETAAGTTAWSGELDSGLGGFTIVRAGSTYRATVTAPEGIFTVTPGATGEHVLTEVAPYPGAGAEAGDTLSIDDVPVDERPTAAPAGGAAAPAERRRAGGKSKITILYGYTASAKAALGGTKEAVKAAAAQSAAETNTALANSGLKVKLKLKGVTKVAGKESASVFTDLRRLLNPRDGKFDGALRARGKKGADLVHLLTGGPLERPSCGAGMIPFLPRTANRALGVSTSYVSCLPYLVATHEIGHNLGADHNKYPGVSHISRTKGSFGYVDPAANFLTVMGYYEPCSDAGNFSCVRIPYFSRPSGTFNGVPTGTRKTNNAKVIKQFAPRVARYYR